jgi:hypothetical protein
MNFEETAARLKRSIVIWLVRAIPAAAAEVAGSLRFVFSPLGVVTCRGSFAPLRLERLARPNAETASGPA